MKAFLILLCIAFALGCIGCGGGGGGGGGTGTQDPTPSPSITLDKTDITLHPGESAIVTATASGGLDGTDLVWGSNPTILAELVSSNEGSSVCRITASPSLGQWEATVRTWANQSVAQTVRVSVVANPPIPPPAKPKVHLSASADTVSLTDKVTITASTTDGLSPLDLVWNTDKGQTDLWLYSSSPDGSTRVYQAMTEGTYDIVATSKSDSSVYGFCQIHVKSADPKPPPDWGIALSVYNLDVPATRAFQIIANIDGDGSDIAWQSDYNRMTVSVIGTGPGYSVCRVESILSAYGVHHVTAHSKSRPGVSATCTVDFGLN